MTDGIKFVCGKFSDFIGNFLNFSTINLTFALIFLPIGSH